jgi:hypothetical protein
MRTKILKMIGGTLIALTLTAAPAYAGDEPPDSAPDPSVSVCGYIGLSGAAMYNHCGDTRVVIRVDRKWPLPDEDKCVGPGWTVLGTTIEVLNAWYIGRLC